MLGGELIQPPRNVGSEAGAFLLLLSGGVLGSVFPDYLSLWKTRALLNLSYSIESRFIELVLLVVDVLTSLVLATCAAFVGNVLFPFFLVATHFAIPTHGQALDIRNLIYQTWATFSHLYDARLRFC